MYQKLSLSNAQKEYMNDLWDGDELCPNCGYETPFESFNPMETDFIECKDCGKKIRPCSLCDSALCGVYETCQEWIPNKHLKEDGTIKITENIDYVFRRSIRQLELAGITQPIIGIKKRTIK